MYLAVSGVEEYTGYAVLKPVIMMYTSRGGYVKAIQPSASAVAEHPQTFDSTVQSERLYTHGPVRTPQLSYKRASPVLLVQSEAFYTCGMLSLT